MFDLRWRAAPSRSFDIMPTPLSSSPATGWSQPRTRTCRASRGGCSSRRPTVPTTPPIISRSPPPAPSRSARRWDGV